MNLSEFHFLRPLWLLALLPLLALFVAAWRRSRAPSGWQAVCDPALLPHLLVEPRNVAARWPWLLLGAAWLLAAIALAGPTWSKVTLPSYRLQAARVVVLDLSRSMDATDLQPSRLARAKFKALDVLKRAREGQTALVVFAAQPYVVAPLTDDANTIAAQIPALATELMPAQGSRPDRAIAKAAQLIREAGFPRGEILLISDGAAQPAAALEAANSAQRLGIRLSVLALGSEEGSPIPLSAGGFLKDASGAIVIAKTDRNFLQQLAHQGGGRFHTLANDDADLDALLGSDSIMLPGAAERGTPQQTEHWRDAGPWLVLAMLPLAALGFRRGWLGGLMVAVVLAPQPSYAEGWSDLWQRRDQQATAVLEQGNAAQAAEMFDDPLWRGTALYRAGRFEDAAAAFAPFDIPLAQYNRGNALAQSGQYKEALAAYDTALKLDPNHADARHNREVVARLLQQQSSADGSTGASKTPAGRDTPGDRRDQGQTPAQASGQATSDDEGGDASAATTPPPSGAEQSGTGQRSEENTTHQGPQQAAAGAAGQADAARKQADSAGRNGKPSDEPRQGDATQGDTLAADDRNGARRPGASDADAKHRENQQALEQWLRRVPDDPGGLLRRKFLRDQQQASDSKGSEQPW